MALVDGFLELERSSGKLEWSAILQKMASDLGFSKILFGLLPKDSQDYETPSSSATTRPPGASITTGLATRGSTDGQSLYPERTADFLGTVHLPDAKAARVLRGSLGRRPGVWADHAAACARGELGALSLSVEAENRAEANRFMESVLPTLWMLKDYALQSGAGLAFEHPVSKPVVLTSREKEVLQWCAIGKTSWEISVICNCSEANVNFHMGNIRRKFGVTSRRVAAIMVVNLGLITL